MSHKEYPRWKHHQSKKSVLVTSPEHEATLHGYTERRDGKLEEGEVVVAPQKPEAPDALSEKSEEDVKELLMSQGIPAKKLKGKSKAELVALLEQSGEE